MLVVKNVLSDMTIKVSHICIWILKEKTKIKASQITRNTVQGYIYVQFFFEVFQVFGITYFKHFFKITFFEGSPCIYIFVSTYYCLKTNQIVYTIFESPNFTFHGITTLQNVPIPPFLLWFWWNFSGIMRNFYFFGVFLCLLIFSFCDPFSVFDIFWLKTVIIVVEKCH